MLIYRCIPDNLITRLDYGIIWHSAQTSEDAFYDLGYMNFTDAIPYFPVKPSDPLLGGKLNTFEDSKERTKAFFLFPWDAIRNIRWLDSRYSNLCVNILEYEIPDEILMEHFGFGYYNGETIPEFKIPISVLKDGKSFLGEINEGLRNHLINRYRARADKSLEFVMPILNNRIQNKEAFEAFTKALLDESSTKTLLGSKEAVFQNLGLSFMSKAITGRNFLVSNRDALAVYKPEKIQSIIDRSNGTLTMDSFIKWKICREATSKIPSIEDKTEFYKNVLFCNGKTNYDSIENNDNRKNI